MHMKNLRFILVSVFTIVFVNISGYGFCQTGEPWSAKELMEPEGLAGLLNTSKEVPVMFNIGPLADIKGAVHVGSTANKAGLDILSRLAAKVPKDKMVVLYCGCCPFRNCPNIRPAFNLLKEQGYKNIRLLNLKHNLKVDWTDNGYPME